MYHEAFLAIHWVGSWKNQAGKCRLVVEYVVLEQMKIQSAMMSACSLLSLFLGGRDDPIISCLCFLEVGMIL
jgi:hypothetical protein